MTSRHDYRAQAERYDQTRAASPSLLGPLRVALAGAPGDVLADVGGGTGNYAVALREDGLLPIVCDVSHAMLARARAKGLTVLRADACALPFDAGAVDAVTMISMLHHVPDWRVAIAEARRVLAPRGRLAVQVITRENLDVHWIMKYFPSSREWIALVHATRAELLDELPGATATPFFYSDQLDGSLGALCREPARLLDPGVRSQTSYFERLATLDPAGLSEGLARLERDLAEGRQPQEEVSELRSKVGDGTIVTWVAPPQ
jgi:SAM-dependent methyltransferase